VSWSVHLAPNVTIGYICSFRDTVSIYRNFSVDGRWMSCMCSTGLYGPVWVREGRHTDPLYFMVLQASGKTINNLENSMLCLNLKPETFKSKSIMLQPISPVQHNTWDWCGTSFMYLLTVTYWPRTFRIITTWKFLEGWGKVCFTLVYLKVPTYGPNKLFLVYLIYW
jgi:hypothetical protein